MIIRVDAVKPGYGSCFCFIGPLFTYPALSVIPFVFNRKFPVLI